LNGSEDLNCLLGCDTV